MDGLRSWFLERRLVGPRVDGRTVTWTAVASSMGVEAASGCYPKRAEVDKTAGVPALWSAATPGVTCSTKRGGMETSNVTTAFTCLLVRSHRAGRYHGGKREHHAR